MSQNGGSAGCGWAAALCKVLARARLLFQHGMERRDGNPTGVDFQRVDELVREYLIFRGFLNTVKVFATERKADKVKGIQPDRIVDQLQAYVLNFEPLNLIDLWKYMEARFFSRLDPRFAKTTKKLEQSLKRYYVVHCMQTNNYGKCKEFFELFADELSGDDEWRSWFMLPFLRTADLPAEFEVAPRCPLLRYSRDLLVLVTSRCLCSSLACASLIRVPAACPCSQPLVRSSSLLQFVHLRGMANAGNRPAYGRRVNVLPVA